MPRSRPKHPTFVDRHSPPRPRGPHAAQLALRGVPAIRRRYRATKFANFPRYARVFEVIIWRRNYDWSRRGSDAFEVSTRCSSCSSEPPRGSRISPSPLSPPSPFPPLPRAHARQVKRRAAPGCARAKLSVTFYNLTHCFCARTRAGAAISSCACLQ